MDKSRNLFRDDIRQLRKFLSFNPFFREMDEHLRKTGYCKNGYSGEHLRIEQIWLLAITDVRKFDTLYRESQLLPDLLRDDQWYDYDTCYLIASVRTYILQARYHGVEGIIEDEVAAWKIVEAEQVRLSGMDAASAQDNAADALSNAERDGWHVMYAALVKGLYINKQVDFTRLVGFAI